MRDITFEHVKAHVGKAGDGREPDWRERSNAVADELANEGCQLKGGFFFENLG